MDLLLHPHPPRPSQTHHTDSRHSCSLFPPSTSPSHQLIIELLLLLGFDRLPVDGHLVGVLQEALISLTATKLLQVSLAIAKTSVDMTSVLESDVQSSVPAVEMDVHLHGAIDERRGSLQKNSFSFIWLTTIECQLRIATFFRGDGLDVLDVLQLQAKGRGETNREAWRGREGGTLATSFSSAKQHSRVSSCFLANESPARVAQSGSDL
jgi:hypothetical protein